MTKTEFETWRRCTPGAATCIYHTGYLAADRLQDAEVDALASAVLELADGGKLYIVQRRHRAGLYDYIAVKRTLQPLAVAAEAILAERQAAG